MTNKNKQNSENNLDIEKPIELLEVQLKGLRKQQKEQCKKISISCLAEKVCLAEHLMAEQGFHIKSLYVSLEIYQLCQSICQRVSTMIAPPPFRYFPPIKFLDYKLYCNEQLKSNEIDIAIKLQDRV